MASEYMEAYRRRSSFLGKTPQERAFNSGVLEFRRYLKYNPHTEHFLFKEKEEKCKREFSGVILTNRQDEHEVTLILLVDIEEQLNVGDLIQWKDDYWLVYQETISSYQPHRKFYITKCNYMLKWVDNEGIQHSSWCRILGSKDSIIKDNFRTWNNLITPQPNKQISVVMPRQEIAKSTEIIVSGEAWYLVDYDQVSIPTIGYYSFNESKINELKDDVENSLANAVSLQEWKIEVQPQTVKVGDIVYPVYSISKNGIVQTEIKPNLTLQGNLDFNENKEIIATEEGCGRIIVSYTDQYGSMTMETIHVTIGGEITPSFIIEGDETLKVTQTKTYSIVSDSVVDAIFELEETNLAAIVDTTSTTCTIKANERNKVGEIVLIAKIGETVLTKTINIISLWQVE